MRVQAPRASLSAKKQQATPADGSDELHEKTMKLGREVGDSRKLLPFVICTWLEASGVILLFGVPEVASQGDLAPCKIDQNSKLVGLANQ